MDIDVKKEIEEQTEKVIVLNSQLQQLQEQRKLVLQELFRKQGIIQYLQSLDGSAEPVVDIGEAKEQD